jgi:CBS-domain-containing membrane protein
MRRPTQSHAARVTLASPALEVMTDLARTSAATIRPQAPIGGANQFMITRGVRLLLVVDDRETVLGVLTATDILGERGFQVSIDRHTKRDDLSVADLMTPAGDVEVLALADVDSARVGHVLETLRRSGRQHALVVEHEVIPPRGPLDKPVRHALVRGIFSLSQIARQLGVAVQTSGEVARTFSEIESALGR